MYSQGMAKGVPFIQLVYTWYSERNSFLTTCFISVQLKVVLYGKWFSKGMVKGIPEFIEGFIIQL